MVRRISRPSLTQHSGQFRTGGSVNHQYPAICRETRGMSGRFVDRVDRAPGVEVTSPYRCDQAWHTAS